MHAAGKFAREGFVDHAVALDPALSPERFRHDIKPEVSLAAGAMPGVTFMPMRFVFDAEAFRCESVAQLFRDEILLLASESFTTRAFAACQVLKV